jgi:hypothetical protein
MFQREELAGAAKASQHFIEDEQRADAIASLAQSAHEARLRDTHATLGLDWLDHDRGISRIDPRERRLVTEWKMNYRPK